MEVTRTPWTEPYTIRERISMHTLSKRYDLKNWWDAGLWKWLVARLPRRLILFAFIRVVSHASAVNPTKHPNEITYEEAYKAWEQR